MVFVQGGKAADEFLQVLHKKDPWKYSQHLQHPNTSKEDFCEPAGNALEPEGNMQ
jgi:hypothetical protein